MNPMPKIVHFWDEVYSGSAITPAKGTNYVMWAAPGRWDRLSDVVRMPVVKPCCEQSDCVQRRRLHLLLVIRQIDNGDSLNLGTGQMELDMWL